MRAEQPADVLLAGAPEHGRAADLVPVELEDRQHGAVAPRIEKAHSLPRPLQRAGLGLTVTDDARRDQVGIVKNCAESVHQGVAELAALVDGARGGDAHVAGDAARCRELPDQAKKPALIQRDLGIDLGIRPFQVHIGDDRGAAVAGACDVQHVAVALLDQPVELHVDEAQRRRGPPVTQQSWLDVFGLQGLAEERVRLEVDLRNRQVVGRHPGGDERVQVDASGGLGQSGQRRHRSRGARSGTLVSRPCKNRARSTLADADRVRDS